MILRLRAGLRRRDAEDADRFALAVDMLRLTFPYLFFVSLAALAGGILNTYHRFGVAAFSPVLLNVVMIVFAAFVAPHYHRPGHGARGRRVRRRRRAAGVHVAVPAPDRHAAAARDGAWRTRACGKIMGLMVPAIFGSSVAQISILLDTLIASFLVTGSISWLYYSDRLMEFPLGMFGIALATVILPNLSRQHASASQGQFAATLDWSIRFVILISAPASVGLVVLAGPDARHALLWRRVHRRRRAHVDAEPDGLRRRAWWRSRSSRCWRPATSRARTRARRCGWASSPLAST